MGFPEVTMSRKKKTIIISILIFVIIVLAIPPLLIYVYLPFAFSGGFEGMRKRRIPAPDINSSAVTSRRTAMKNDIEAALNVLDNSAVFTRYAISTHDRCYKGEANWKTIDPYAHRCELRVTHFYGFNGDFRAQMIKFETLLIYSGWAQPYDLSIQRVMIDYYDPRYGRPMPFLRGNSDRRYLVSDLPAPSEYRKNNLVLNIVYVEKETDNLFRLGDAQNVVNYTRVATHDDKEFQDAKALFQNITKSCKYLLAVPIQGTYFEN
jgi:hypothetical protein